MDSKEGDQLQTDYGQEEAKALWGKDPREFSVTTRPTWSSSRSASSARRSAILQQLGVKLDERGNVWTDENKMTSVPGVFAAGDMSRGQSLVGDQGRPHRRARVDRYLSYGETVLPP